MDRALRLVFIIWRRAPASPAGFYLNLSLFFRSALGTMSSPSRLSTRPTLPLHILAKLERRHATSPRHHHTSTTSARSPSSRSVGVGHEPAFGLHSPVGADDACGGRQARNQILVERRFLQEQKMLVEHQRCANARDDERQLARARAHEALGRANPGFSKRRTGTSSSSSSPRTSRSARS